MEKLFYHHQNAAQMTREVLAWLDEPEAASCRSLRFAANCSLSQEASDALVRSPRAAHIESLEFTEIYFSPQQLADLLTLPSLIKLCISGGVSYDWNGPEYSYPTLGLEHLKVLETSPHAQKLQVLSLSNQQMGEGEDEWRRKFFPNLHR